MVVRMEPHRWQRMAEALGTEAAHDQREGR